MKRWVTLILVLMAGSIASAQPGSGIRHNFKLSRLVLVSGDTLDGPISVRTSPDMVSLTQADGRVRTFGAAQVAAFAVQGEVLVSSRNRRAAVTFDSTVIRLFRTLTWQSERLDRRPEPLFFEQLSEGPVLLLRRQSHVQVLGAVQDPGLGQALNFGGKGSGARNQMPPAPRSVSHLVKRGVWDTFYLAWPTGEIRLLRNIKKDFLAAFPQQAKQLQAYAKAQRLGYSSAAELHELANYANSLASTSSR